MASRAPTYDPEKLYVNRPESVVVVNLSLDRDAARLLTRYGDRRRRGKFVSQLIYAHAKKETEADKWDEMTEAIQQLRDEIRKQEK